MITPQKVILAGELQTSQIPALYEHTMQSSHACDCTVTVSAFGCTEQYCK